jgi:hypothetical protein
MRKRNSEVATENVAVAAETLRQSILKCRAEGVDWRIIANACKMPQYAVRVMAGETIRNRTAPEFSGRRR